MVSPAMVEAMGGTGLVVTAHLQITDAGGHALPVEGAIFVVISRRDRETGLTKWTHQMMYVSKKTEELVLSCDALVTAVTGDCGHPRHGGNSPDHEYFTIWRQQCEGGDRDRGKVDAGSHCLA